METTRLSLPLTWADAARRLGTSKQQLSQSRAALEIKTDPLDAETFEKLRRITLFCQSRNTGGGGSCTRREYVRLMLAGEDRLEERLRKMKII